MRRKQAFTLIELLVVIAIIAILAAILFPVFAKARDQARSIACLSNNKQIALALQMYVEDYDEAMLDREAGGTTGGGGVYNPGWNSDGDFDYSRFDPSVTPNRLGWGFLIQPYMKNTQMLYCSSSLQKPSDPTNLSYAMRNGPQYLAVAWGWNKLASWGRPAQTIWIHEWCLNHGGGGIDASRNAPDWQNGIPYAKMGRDAGMNVSYLDGHAKFYIPRPCDPGMRGDDGVRWNFWWFNGYDPNENMYFMCP